MRVQAQEVRRDPALRGLRSVADPSFMHRLLAPHFDDQASVESVELHDFAYRPQRSARFVYELGVRDRSGTQHRHFMHGWLADHERTARRVERFKGRRWATPRFGPAFMHVPDLDFLIWGFPNDPRIELAPFADAQRTTSTLRGALETVGTTIDACCSRIVHYVPRKRIVMHHIVEPSGRHVYTKTFGHRRGAESWRVAQALWASAQKDALAFTIAPPLAYLDDSRTLVQDGLVDWERVHADSWIDSPPRMHRLGRALARLHTSTVPSSAVWGPERELELFERVADAVQRFDPASASQIDLLRQWGRSGAGMLATLPEVPIHAAFRFNQLMTDQERIALVDLDGVQHGDPRADVGSLLAQVHSRVVKGRRGAREAQSAAAAFLAGYRVDVPWSVRDADLAWYAGLRLFSKHAIGPVNHLKRDARTRIATLVEVAKRILRTRHAGFPGANSTTA